jgi:cytidylate kinase
MRVVIAVDGPAASGKGTVALGLARAFNLPYLDTGLLYRAVGMFSMHPSTGWIDEARAVDVASKLDLASLDDPRLRTRNAGEAASIAAAMPSVRAALLDYQKRFAAQDRGAVLDGRDIGTVIAPTAQAKLFVSASPEVRAERRYKQLIGQGEHVELDDILADIRIRDERDSGRASAPLVQAQDAVLLDTSDKTISQAAEAARRIVQDALSRWERSRG